MNFAKIGVLALTAFAAAAPASWGRDQVQATGSSTVLPYATIVAEAFGENFDFPSPVIEGGGSGAGRKKFCEGVGENTADIANSSSRITSSDIALCKRNGVTEIMEIRIGYDGIVFASAVSGPKFDLTPKSVFTALSAKIVVGGKLVDNTMESWSDVYSQLPAQPITVFVPGTKHGTREVFDAKVMEAGCKANGAYELFLKSVEGADKKEKEANAKKACAELRTDGKAVDIDGDYTETLARLASDPQAVGVFGMSFYENNTDKLRVATMKGIEPTADTVASGKYPVSRPLFIYVKKAHIGVIPGLKEFVEFFVSDDMAGPNGPLAAYGLVPDPELKATQAAVAAGKVLTKLK